MSKIFYIKKGISSNRNPFFLFCWLLFCWLLFVLRYLAFGFWPITLFLFLFFCFLAFVPSRITHHAFPFFVFLHFVSCFFVLCSSLFDLCPSRITLFPFLLVALRSSLFALCPITHYASHFSLFCFFALCFLVFVFWSFDNLVDIEDFPISNLPSPISTIHPIPLSNKNELHLPHRFGSDAGYFLLRNRPHTYH